MAKHKGPSIGAGSLPTTVASGVPEAVDEATSALKALEAQLKAVDRAMGMDALAKQLEKATDPLKKQQAQLRLALAVRKDIAADAVAASKAEAAAAKVAALAAKATAKPTEAKSDVSPGTVARTKALLAKQFQLGDFTKQNATVIDKLGGFIEEKFGKKVFRSFKKSTEGTGSFVDTLRIAGVGLKIVGGLYKALGSVALGVAGAIAGVTFEGAKFATEMGIFKENTQFAMKYALGSGTAAESAMSAATDIAAKIGASVTDIAPMLQEMFSKGLGAGESEQLVQMFADMKALHVNPTALLDGIMSLKNNGSITPAMLAPLRELGGAAQERVFASLATSLGISSKNAKQRQQQVLSQLPSLRGQKGMDAFDKAMLAATGEDKAGGVHKRLADTTVEGSFNKVKNQLTNLFTKIESGGAGQAVVKVFNRMADALNPTTAEGKRLLALLDRVANVAGKMFDKLDAGRAVDAFETVLIALHLLDAASETPSMQKLGAALKYAAIGAGILAVALGIVAGLGLLLVVIPLLIVAALGLAAAAMIGWAGDLVDTLWESGGDAITGFVEGILEKTGLVSNAMTTVGDVAAKAMAKALDAHSPSRVFMRLGAYTGEGMAIGIDRSAPMVERSVAAMVAPTEVDSARSNSGSRSASMVNHVTNHFEINGAGDAKAVGQEVTRQVAELFEHLGMQFGVVGPGAA